VLLKAKIEISIESLPLTAVTFADFIDGIVE
jgi:hypothetical protein